MTTTKIGNTLSSCVTSPYLLQHAHNPVHWMPWGLQAHRLAKQLNKPIFLSIGYTSCHWCHVMERESFENEEIAQMLNEYFVNIKVDKEERPDVDRVYMTYVQATTGSGGWPLSVFLTPDLKPFVGGTYFPPEEKFGHTGFKTLIKRVHKVWSEDAQTVEIKASNMFNMMKSSLVGQYGTGNETNLASTGSIVDVARRFYRQMAVRFNKEYGGFSEAPLFPRPSEMQCLLALSASGTLSQQDRKQSVNMVLHTLRKMSHGGIHDHIGGGFSRYSVDECWHVPHFEKMLYDNAQLLQAFSSAFKESHDPYFASVADDIFDYIKRDMTHSSGAFYSAQDADSRFTFDSSESKEGAYYIYSRQEVLKLLPGIIGEIFCFHYNIMEGGNCNLSVRSDPHGEFQGFSVPIELGNDPVGQTAQQFKRDRNEIINILKEGSRELLKWRQQNRPPPVTDDKIITAWNAMMISACARAHCSFVVQTKDGMPEQTEFLKAAIRAMESLENNMFLLDRSSGSKRLLRSIRYVDDKPIPGPGGFADDYAWMIAAYLDLYEATADHNYIQRALALQDLMDAKFKSGDRYLSSDPKDDPTVLIQLAELHDGAEPSPNSVALGNLYRLRNIVDTEAGQKYTDMANAIWNWARPTANELPNALPFLLANNITFDANADRLLKIVIMAEKKGDLVKQFLREIYSRHLPGLQVICITSKEAYEYFSSINNTIKSMAYLHDDQQPRLHLCAGFTCYPPIIQISALSNMLNELQEKEYLSQ